MKKTLTVSLVLFLLLAATFSAVAGGKGQSTPTQGKPYAGIQLNVLDVSYGPTLGMKEYLGEFEEATGIKVNFEIEEYSAITTKKEVELSARSDAYDVIHIDSTNVARYGNAGWAENLMPRINASPEYQYNDFLPAAAAIFKQDNSVYGIPVSCETWVNFYRKDVFDELGLTPPRTPEELLAVCEKIKASGKDIYPVSMRGRQGQGNNVFQWGFLLYALNGRYYNDGMTALTLNSPETVASVKLYAKLVQDYSPPGAVDATYTDAWTAFAQGKAAMFLDTTTAASNFQQQGTSAIIDKWDVVRIFSALNIKYLPMFSHGITINAFSRKKDAAWEYVKWYTGREMQRKLGEEVGFPGTTRLSSRASDLYKSKVGPNRWIEVFNESGNFVRDDYRPLFLPEWTYIGDTIGVALQNVFMGADAQTTFDALQRDMTAFFNQNGYLKK